VVHKKYTYTLLYVEKSTGLSKTYGISTNSYADILRPCYADVLTEELVKADARVKRCAFWNYYDVYIKEGGELWAGLILKIT
jgi:hypothetical protein